MILWSRSVQERDDFEAYDKVHSSLLLPAPPPNARAPPQIHKVRATLVDALKKEFADYGLTYSIGGQISFDMLCVPLPSSFPLHLPLTATRSPNGWDKTYALTHVAAEKFKEVHFFGDKTYKGGNDYEIFEDPRTIGHAVQSPEDTMRELKVLFDL